jgi:hypothetical protein
VKIEEIVVLKGRGLKACPLQTVERMDAFLGLKLQAPSGSCDAVWGDAVRCTLLTAQGEIPPFAAWSLA